MEAIERHRMTQYTKNKLTKSIKWVDIIVNLFYAYKISPLMVAAMAKDDDEYDQ